MYKIKIVLFFLFFATKITFSQEFQQFYENPEYYNGAFAGKSKCTNIILQNKIHPISKGINFFSNNLILNTQFAKRKISPQLSFFNHSGTGNTFNHQKISLSVAYNFRIKRKSNIIFSAEINYNSKNFNNSNLIFPSMINIWDNSISANTEAIPDYKNRTINFGAGNIFYTRNYYLSISISNLFSIFIAEKQKPPLLVNFIGEKKISISPTHQYFTINIGIFSNFNYYITKTGATYNHNNIFFGLFSLQNIYDKNLSNGISTSLGLRKNKIKITTNYNFYYGGLLSKKSGSFEIGIRIFLKCAGKNINNTINCPAYQF